MNQDFRRRLATNPVAATANKPNALGSGTAVNSRAKFAFVPPKLNC